MLFETQFFFFDRKLHICFRNFELLHFCTLFSTICGTVVKNKMSQGARFQGFCDFLAHFEVEGGRNFWFEMRHKIAVFYHVLSVVPSVSVQSAMESNDVLMTCFCAVSLDGTMRSLKITFQKCRLWRQHKPLSCGPTHDVSSWSSAPHKPASAPRGRPMLRDATSPSERSLCNHRFVVDCGKPSVVAIFLAPKPRVAMRSMTKRSSVDRTML